MNSSGDDIGSALVGVLRSDASTASKMSAIIDAFENADEAGRLKLLLAVSREAIILIECDRAFRSLNFASAKVLEKSE